MSFVGLYTHIRWIIYTIPKPGPLTTMAETHVNFIIDQWSLTFLLNRALIPFQRFYSPK